MVTRTIPAYSIFTSRHMIVYFSIVFCGGCKFVVQGYPRMPRKLNPNEIRRTSGIYVCGWLVSWVLCWLSIFGLWYVRYSVQKEMSLSISINLIEFKSDLSLLFYTNKFDNLPTFWKLAIFLLKETK